MKFNPTQQLVATHYAGGEFAHIADTDRLDCCGDTLFKFCILEAGDAVTPGDLWHMLETAIANLRSLQGEFEV